MLRGSRFAFVTAALSLATLPAGAEEASPAPAPPPPPSLTPRLTPSPGRIVPPPPRDAGEKPGGAATGSGPVLTVAEISEEIVTLAGPIIGLAPLQVGRVLDHDGATVGRVIIEKILENGVVARVYQGRENVRWGARVRFDAPGAKR